MTRVCVVRPQEDITYRELNLLSEQYIHKPPQQSSSQENSKSRETMLVCKERELEQLRRENQVYPHFILNAKCWLIARPISLHQHIITYTLSRIWRTNWQKKSPECVISSQVRGVTYQRLVHTIPPQSWRYLLVLIKLYQHTFLLGLKYDKLKQNTTAPFWNIVCLFLPMPTSLLCFVTRYILPSSGVYKFNIFSNVLFRTTKDHFKASIIPLTVHKKIVQCPKPYIYHKIGFFVCFSVTTKNKRQRDSIS